MLVSLEPALSCACYLDHLSLVAWDISAGLTSLDVSADSTVIITGSEDMTARISNLHTGKVLGTFQGTQHMLHQSDPWLAQYPHHDLTPAAWISGCACPACHAYVA